MDAWLSDKKTIQRSKRYYAHFDVRTDIGRMKDYVSNPKAVAAHGFYPFIHYEMNMSKFKRGKGVVPKKRDICYPTNCNDAAVKQSVIRICSLSGFYKKMDRQTTV